MIQTKPFDYMISVSKIYIFTILGVKILWFAIISDAIQNHDSNYLAWPWHIYVTKIEEKKLNENGFWWVETVLTSWLPS